MRKHLYLITEHENEDRVGCVKMSDKRFDRVSKNEEGPIQKFDKDAKDFKTVGKQVGVGYYDFESQAQYDDNEFVADVMQEKLGEIDDEWLEKAGVDI